MTGTDENGNYQTGKIIEIQGPMIVYRLGTVPLEFDVEVPNPGVFSPGQAVKVYQNGMVLPL